MWGVAGHTGVRTATPGARRPSKAPVGSMRTRAGSELVAENARTTSLVLQPADWPGHRAGQHVDMRLTAEDGYQTQRSDSIASAPEDERTSSSPAAFENDRRVDRSAVRCARARLCKLGRREVHGSNPGWAQLDARR
jgi:hypothetical protein